MSKPQSQQKTLIDPAPGPYRDQGKSTVATTPQNLEANLTHIEELANKYALSACQTKGRFERALILSEGMEALRQAVQPLLPRMTRLMNSPLGFLTDRKDKNNPYPDDVLLDALIESTLRGLYPIGNEWNIIAGRCYVTKEGYARLVREVPDLTDLRLEPGVPKMATGGAVVPFRASWKIKGKGYTLIRDIPVRLNQGMGVDGAIGKATRKMLASIHNRCTGSFLTEGDAQDDDLPALPPPKTNGSPAGATQQQKGQMTELATRLHLSEDEFKEVAEQFGAEAGDPAKLTQKQAEELLMHLEDLAAAELDGRDPAEVAG